MPKETNPIRVGVYGTLRSGLHNHYLLNKARFLGISTLRSPLAMFRCGFLPYVMFKENEVHTLKLEFYEVTSADLVKLDQLEGHPDWYKRVKIPTAFGDAWVYLMPDKEDSSKALEYVPHGDWKKSSAV